MKLEKTGLENVKADLNRLDDVMLELGLVREGQWDYDRVTYDRKFEMAEGVFYLRVQGYATEGDVGAHKAVIQLITPLLGKHYFPHGVEYGEGENFPKSLVTQCEKIKSLVTQCEKILADLQSKIATFAL
ncbi:MAG: hypothetical protein K0S25_185 [Bacillus sp. (in: firmicutes)]|nr:hypothetical protein [Bacillus sp. (in: firmicutes)]